MNNPIPLSTLKELAQVLADGPIPPAQPGALESWQITLTPEFADMLLKNNNGNRRISSTRVEKMAADLRQGRWQVNGTTVKISESGRLMDGQHRCQVVIETGIPITTLIVFGVSHSSDVFATIDQEGPRTVRDIIETTTDRRVETSLLAATNLLGSLTEGIDLSTRPRQAEFLLDNIDEVAPWLSWAEHIANAAPVIINPLGIGKPTLRTIGRTQLAVLAMHMSRAGADPQSVQDFYVGLIGELPPTTMREMSDNQLSILQLVLKRLKGGRVLNRTSGSAVGPVLSEYATHINVYNRWVTDAKVGHIRTPDQNYRYLDELPWVSDAVRVVKVVA